MTALALERVTTGRRTRQRRRRVATLALVALVLVLGVTMLCLGETTYSLAEVGRVLLGEQVKGASFAVGTLRLPRALAGILAGLAFGAAGASFQTMLRNPLASPDIIGISAGASAAAVWCILVLHWSGPAVSVIAVVAGLVVAGAIYALARGGESAGGRLILIGIGVGAMLDSVVSYLLLNASAWDVPTAVRWLTGSLNGIRMEAIAPLAVAVVVLGGALLFVARDLRALEFGDQSATALGVRVDAVRLVLVLAAVGLVAFATATTGPIAFVAFLAGPIATRLVGAGAPVVLPAALTGAALVLAADLLGQFAFDTRFPVGVVTGMIGAPYLLFLLIRLNRAGGSA
ncbi:MAG: iron chelate uptake ABC transporter family permease subunit [Propionicimonas sp.]|nr:iron chelate uptake ABC transporter family permease subunit [Propionicimonas sp.]